jgi:hypothetical protein
MKWLCGLLATAALFAGVFVPVARSESDGPLAGVQAICAQQGGTYQLGTPAGPVACHGVSFVIHREIPGSYASSQLVAVDRLCKAAGFIAVREFGKGLPDGGFLVVTWACV